MIGKSVDAHPEIVKQAYDEGHYIANHGYDHNNYTLVILMHDTKDVNDSSLILKNSIAYLRLQGYEFRNFYEFVPYQR